MHVRSVLAALCVAFILALSVGTAQAAPSPRHDPVATTQTSDPTSAITADAAAGYNLIVYTYIDTVYQANLQSLAFMQSLHEKQVADDAAAAAASVSRSQTTTVQQPAAVSRGSGNCASGGGNYQANPNGQYVQRESGGDYCIANPSGACGAYQIMPGTWNGFGGYSSACDAPPAVQDEKAATMAPCNWQPPNYCAGH